MSRAETLLPLTALLTCVGGAALAQDAADAEAAQLAFNNHCRTCHVTAPDDHRLGPSLHGIVGREAGSAPGFGYSSAMAAADLVWDEEMLDRYIENPDAVVPGNAMKPFAGVASAAERAKIVAYLKSESAGG